jgi:hypothetical protein
MAKRKTDKERRLEETLAFCGLVAENFRVFTSEIMGFEQENAPFHDEIDDALSNPLNRKVTIALPRGFGKTNHLSIAYPLWEIARNHNLRILLVSSTAELSKKSLGAIVDVIERNPRYRAWAKIIDGGRTGVVPRRRARQNRDENWSADSIVIQRDAVAMRDATIQAVSVGGSVLSRRANIIILDDLVTQENAASEEQRIKVKEWVRNTLFPVLIPGGRIICMGNVWHMDDLMNELLKDPQFQVRKRIPAILHEANRRDLWDQWAAINLDESLTVEQKETKAKEFRSEHRVEMDEGVEVLWPERFTYEDLYMIRLSDQFSFARMYMCDPSIRPNQKFFEKDIEAALAKGKNLVLQGEENSEYETEMTTCGLDLAVSQESWGDDTVLLTLDRVRYGSKDETIRKGDYVIRNIERGKFSPDDTRKMVALNEYTVKPIATRVETNGMQEMMHRDLGDSGALVTSYKTGGEKNDPAIGVNSLAVLFEQGKIILPNSAKDPRTRRLVAQLVNELRAFPDGHTGDSLMAFWFAFSEMRDRIGSRFIIPAAPLEPPPQGPQNEMEADRQMIADQAWGRAANDYAARLQREVRESQARAAPQMPNKLDPDLEQGLQQKMTEGWTLLNAQTWAWNEQAQRFRKNYWNGVARRML